MLKVALIISQPRLPSQEVESGADVLSLGSALDNSVCLEEDSGVARYHAVIERRGEGFWLCDLGSREGTKLNGGPIVLDRELGSGDRITLGEECVIEFYCHEDAGARAADAPPTPGGHGLGAELGSAAASGIHAPAAHANSPAARPAAAEPPPGMSPAVKVGVGVLGGLLLTGTAAALLFSASGDCQPQARILTPVNGAALRSAATIRVEASETQCIRRVSYQLDGEEVASASAAPYEATLDPRRLTRFAAGNHVLTATVETEGGGQMRQPGEVYVALVAPDERPAGGPTPAPEPTPAPVAADARPAAADVQAMAERLASQISGKSGYVFERELTARIEARTAEFAAAGATERAARYRRLVVKSFGDHGLKPFLGFVLASSRSKFDAAAGPEGSPLWHLPPAVAQGYLQAGETPRALEDPQRGTEVAAVYLKHLLGVFESENFDLAVACYGCTMEEAGALKQRLAAVPPAERRNLWRLVERGLLSPEQAERVVRFYAAGIVGENPQRFGAASDNRPLSSLEY